MNNRCSVKLLRSISLIGHNHSVIQRSMSQFANLLDNTESNRQSYENTLVALNSLQTNASYLRQSTQPSHDNGSTCIQDTLVYLKKSGLSYKELDKLSIIHVAGTKGKGSTCALTESILRACDVKTGFFSSPHLIHVNERFRLNGIPISNEKFSKYFWMVYDRLYKQRSYDYDMPPYFKFLTVMAFHVFLEEKVDVAIMEVGIGGEYDSTNVVRNTKTAGISSLGLDHTSLLGDTLTDIAWQKGGIIKPNCHVFSNPQPNECITTLESRSIERNAFLHWVPTYDSYNWPILLNKRKIPSIELLNGSLAIQLSYDWLKSNPKKCKNKIMLKTLLNLNNEMCLEIFDEVIMGLEKCRWPGRFQIMYKNNMRIFIDCAHTLESIQLCAEWFCQEVTGSNRKRFLLFNLTGNRNPEPLLKILQKGNFTEALFSANSVIPPNDEENKNNKSRLEWYSEQWQNLSPAKCKSKTFSCTTDVFQYFSHSHLDTKNIDVLITGSVYLVGAAIESIHKM